MVTTLMLTEYPLFINGSIEPFFNEKTLLIPDRRGTPVA
jgi:hypothetical protein